MSYVPYKSTDTAWAWKKEPSFRTNAHGKDTTNAAGDTMYALPIFISSDAQSYVRQPIKWKKYKGQASRFNKRIYKESVGPVNLTLTGPLLNFSWMAQLMDECTTAGPVSGNYTHISDSSNTITNPPQSIQLYQQIPNDKTGGGEDTINLYVGCIIKSGQITTGVNRVLIGTFEIEVARLISGTKLTSLPQYTDNQYNMSDAVFTFLRATVAYNCRIDSFAFKYTTDKALKGEGTYYPVVQRSPNNVDASIEMNIESWETDVYDNTQVLPSTTPNDDLTVKFSKTDVLYLQFQIPNGFQEFLGSNFSDGFLQDTISFQINPHDAGSKLLIEEKNTLTNTLYEGA